MVVPKFLTLSLVSVLSLTSLSLLAPQPARAGWVRNLEQTVVNSEALERALPAYQWNARPAIDYLDKPGDARVAPGAGASPGAHPLPPIQTVRSPLAPTLPSPPKIIPPSLASRAFDNGAAGSLSYEQMVDAKIFVSDPLNGSVFKRKGAVKYIILHSTETANPADAQRVILSWNNRGLRHPGSQFVVDRDGTIYSTVNPDDVVVHIDPNRCLAGYSNDNSVGIEIVRSGKQEYTQLQLGALTKLVSYLQAHYGIEDSAVTTHHHVQPSDRTDPVGFDFLAFEDSKSELRNLAARFDSLNQTQIGMRSNNNSNRLLAHRPTRRVPSISDEFPEPMVYTSAPSPGPRPDAVMPLPAPDYKRIDY